MKSFPGALIYWLKIALLVCASIALTLLFEAVMLLPSIWLPVPMWITKVSIAILIITRFYQYLALWFRQNPYTMVLVSIVCIYAMVSIFYPPAQGKDGFVYTRNNPHKYSKKHWYFLNRVNPVSPFDHTGMAYISKKDNLILPGGYITQRPVTKDGWYGIRTKRFLVIAVGYGFIMGFLATSICASFLSKTIKNKSKVSKN